MKKGKYREVNLGSLFNIFTGRKNVNETNLDGEYTFFSCAPETFKSNDYIHDGEAIIIAGNGSFTGTTRYFNGKFDLYQRTYALTPKEKDSIDTKYVFYKLKKSFEPKFMGGTRGSSIPYIVMGDISDFIVSLPPLPEQKRIANILSSFDNKIELLREQNKTLENIAQTIFKQWFIDFNFPDSNGKPYKDNGGKMKESELGEIPEGWEIREYSKMGDLKNGVNYSRDEKGDTVCKIINTRDVVKNSYINKSNLEEIKIDKVKATKYRLKDEDILIVRSASPGETAVVHNPSGMIIYSGFIIRLRPKDKKYKWLLYHDLKEKGRSLTKFSEGTVMKNINQKIINNSPLLFPNNNTLEKFSNFANDIHNKIWSNYMGDMVLGKHKKELLNKLI